MHQHLHRHRDVSFKLFGNQIKLNAFGQCLQQFFLKVILFFDSLSVLVFFVLDSLLIFFDFPTKFFSFLFSQSFLHFHLFYFLLLFHILSLFFVLKQFPLKLLKLLLLLPQNCFSFFFNLLLSFFVQFLLNLFFLQIQLVLGKVPVYLALFDVISGFSLRDNHNEHVISPEG